eukprot:CAMPEP_0202711570 /NCGR_PEP_ID=MMETSP1385-20130828/23338_1 /ASSEMBLY_ACC=CAM_ASM_000861 /TAXON_ID=933848 /ORGANISM="Elphidium margaritaceum" /LENGTH=723 /DNA_ID=CAMNT_0049371323 /DNA_START=296 /DNA_END=2464 /DNA_ORIENTATION=+
MMSRQSSMESVASDLSDHNLAAGPDTNWQKRYTLPLNIIITAYFYYHRYQSYLFLLSGSEESKDVSYNQIQIINLRTVSDVHEKSEYAYTNFRIEPVPWTQKVQYKKYFNKSVQKYVLQSKTVITPEPVSALDVGAGADSYPSTKETSTTTAGNGATEKDNADNKSKRKPMKPQGIQISAPVGNSNSNSNSNSNGKDSPWNAANSPFSPLNDDGDDDTLKFAAMKNLKSRPRTKSSINILSPTSANQELASIPENKTSASKKSPSKAKRSTITVTSASGKVLKKGAPNSTNIKPSKAAKTSKTSSSKAKSMKQMHRASAKVSVPSTVLSTTKSADLAQTNGRKSGKSSSSKKLVPRPLKKTLKRKSTTAILPTKMKQAKNKVFGTKEYDRYSFGETLMSISNNANHRHRVVPSWPWLRLKYKSDVKRERDQLEFCHFQMMVRCGGISANDDEYTNQNDLILFNAANLNDVGRQIDAYHCKLPPFKQQLEAASIIYDQNNNLLCFGGYSYGDGKALKSIQTLNLNTKRNQFKWKKYGCLMNKARYHTTVVHTINRNKEFGALGQNKFVIIGGKTTSSKPMVDVEMFDSSKTTKESKCTQLAELSFARFKPGACVINDGSIRSNRIACCGGILYGKGTNKVEILDLNKNQWIVHGTRTQYEHQHPALWTGVQQINPNILYVAGNNISFGAKKGSLGFIEWTDLRTNEKEFNLLYQESLEDLYEFW